MAITKQITQAPPAPQRSEPDTFADKADAFVVWLEDFADDLVDWTNQVNLTAEEINLCLKATETARDEALATVNAEVYDSNQTYNYPDVVIGSDGHCYRCLGENVQGDDPVGSSTGNWLKLTLSADDVEDFVTEKISEKLPQKEIVMPPNITGVSGAKYNTTITLTAIGSKSAFESDGVCIDYYEWQLPDGSTATGNSINYTMPDSSHVGDILIFKCRAVDSLKNTSSWVTFNVSILDKEPPIISSVEIEDVLMDNHAYTITINASDPEDGSLQYKVSCNNSKVTISPSAWSSNNTFTITFPDFVTDTKIILTYHVSNDVAETTQAEEKIVYNNTTILALIDSGDDDYLHSIATDSKKNIFVCGTLSNYCYIGKLSNNFEFIKQVGFPSNIQSIEDVKIDSNDNVFLCGFTVDSDFYIAKLDSNLNVIKQITIDSGSGSDALRSITIDSSGNVYVCGDFEGGTNRDVYIAKFDNDLNLVSQITIDSGNGEFLSGIAIDSSGNIFVAGSWNNGTNSDLCIMKFDNSFNVVKQVTIDSGGSNGDFLYDIDIDSNGNVFVCGVINAFEMYVAKFDNDLNVTKQITFNVGGSNEDLGTSIDIDSNNNIYISGHLNSEFQIIKFDNNLNILKQIQFNGGGRGKGNLLGIDLDSFQNVYVCGHFKDSAYNKFSGFISKIVNFDNYNGTKGYILGSYSFIKQDTSYSSTSQSYTVTNQSWSATSQSWSVTTQSWTSTEKNYVIWKDQD